MSNSIVLDLRKVQWGQLRWGNGEVLVDKKPDCPTVKGCEFDLESVAVPTPNYEGETMLERATRLNLLDSWTPIVRFQLAANHNVCYSGAKALSMWRAWQSYVFSKQKKKGNKNET